MCYVGLCEDLGICLVGLDWIGLGWMWMWMWIYIFKGKA